MADAPRSRPTQRPRPVAEVSLERLSELAPDVVRGWAVALIRARPLEEIGEVPLQALAGEGLSLCEQLLRALCSESDFDRLLDNAPHGRESGISHPRQALEIAGGGDPGNVVETIESLRGVIWETIAAQLSAPIAGGRSQTSLLADLSDRLANVCAALSAGAIAGSSAGSVAPMDVVIVPGASPVARSPEDVPTRPARTDTGIVIVDERGAIRRDAYRHESGGRTRRTRDEPPAEAEQEELSAPAEIAIRDARAEEGPAAWIRSIGRQLESYERDGLPFAVVLLEIEGVVAREEQESLERVLADELRESGGGTLTRERAGRYWLLAHRADRIGAHALAVRLERALATAATSGAPVVAASGIAICPEDGMQPATLAAQADVGLYAARSEAGHASTGPVQPPA